MASGERGPAGRVDALNYLVDSVNWSHSDWANLCALCLLYLIPAVVQPQTPAWYQGRRNDHCREDSSQYISAFLTTISFREKCIACIDAERKSLS